jgi:tryptophanyl-tRNA synthetase
MKMSDTEQKKVILSGIQPTGGVHLGNLFGAIRNWVKLQDEYECYFMLADLHAITVKQVPADLRKSTLDMAATLIACGIDPERCTLFVQSMVKEHSMLSWVLNCYTPMSRLSLMTQFKDKSAKNADNVNVGLFSYPVLQVADILLYQADMVPVGEDQKQHLELTRDVAGRFNHQYSETFKIPEPFIPKAGARVMSLQEPEKKMSKSDENQNSCIFITDEDNVIKKKIMRAVTDSEALVKFDEKKPGVSNLMSLYHIVTEKTYDEIEKEFEGKGYGDFKKAVADAVAGYIAPIREKYNEVRNDKKFLEGVLTNGAQNAGRTAFKTLRKVYKKVGFVQF